MFKTPQNDYLKVIESKPLTYEREIFNASSKQVYHKNKPKEEPKETGQRLKLKDYLRLTTIKKRESSNSKKKITLPQSSEIIEEKEETTIGNESSIRILKEELESDLQNCIKMMNELFTKVENSQSKITSAAEEYEELVYLCEMQRIVKENIQGNIDRANHVFSERRQVQLFRNMPNSGLLGEDMKRSSIHLKRMKSSSSHSKTRSNHKICKSNIDPNYE